MDTWGIAGLIVSVANWILLMAACSTLDRLKRDLSNTKPKE